MHQYQIEHEPMSKDHTIDDTFTSAAIVIITNTNECVSMCSSFLFPPSFAMARAATASTQANLCVTNPSMTLKSFQSQKTLSESSCLRSKLMLVWKGISLLMLWVSERSERSSGTTLALLDNFEGEWDHIGFHVALHKKIVTFLIEQGTFSCYGFVGQN